MPDIILNGLKLSEYIDALLVRKKNGSQLYHYREVPRHLADTIKALTDNEHTCYIQYADEFSPHLPEPLLWEWSAWRSQCDTWVRERNRAEKQRVERFILQANVALLSKKIFLSDLVNIEIESARILAYKLITRKEYAKMKQFGVEKLYEKEEEVV